MRTAIYCRVSTREQQLHGYSVDNQLDALKEYAKTNNLDVVGIYNDAGHSARKKYTTRPALMNLLDDVKADKIDLIIFTKLDRWFRNVGDYHAVNSILDAHNVKWRSIWEDYETETSSGQLKVNIMLSVNEAEASRTHERVMENVAYRKAKGQRIAGIAPVGYCNAPNGLVIDESTKPIMECFWSSIAYTRSTQIARNKVYDEFNYVISAKRARDIIKNPVYSGSAYYPTPAYTTPEIQNAMLSNSLNRNSNRAKSTYIFSGLVECGECGYKMVGRRFKTQKGYKLNYYCLMRNGELAKRGHGFQISPHEDYLEQYLVDNIDTLLEAIPSDVDLSVRNSNDAIEKKIEDNKKKIERIGDRYEAGEITKSAYIDKINAIKEENFILSQQIHSYTELKLPSTWKEMYMELDPQHKQVFWKEIIKKIIIYHDKDPQIIFVDKVT